MSYTIWQKMLFGLPPMIIGCILGGIHTKSVLGPLLAFILMNAIHFVLLNLIDIVIEKIKRE